MEAYLGLVHDRVHQTRGVIQERDGVEGIGVRTMVVVERKGRCTARLRATLPFIRDHHHGHTTYLWQSPLELSRARNL